MLLPVPFHINPNLWISGTSIIIVLQSSFHTQLACVWTFNQKRENASLGARSSSYWLLADYISLEQARERVSCWSVSRINFIPILESIFYSACCFAYYFQSF